MQHSQLRKPNEKVKLFAKVSSQQNLSLTVWEFKNGTLVEITPHYVINDLNTGYYSTEIITPDHSCYLLILFCGNPIVLRVGNPALQFFFWAPKQKTYGYKHFDEFGSLLDQGELIDIGYGFYYTTPINDTLGYIEVLGKPYIIHVPYCSGSVGVGIDIDWQKTIIRQRFGVNISKLNFKLNIKELNFVLKSELFSFDVDVKQLKFTEKTIPLKFKATKEKC